MTAGLLNSHRNTGRVPNVPAADIVDLTQDDDHSVTGDPYHLTNLTYHKKIRSKCPGNRAAKFLHGDIALASQEKPFAKFRAKTPNGTRKTHTLWANRGASKCILAKSIATCAALSERERVWELVLDNMKKGHQTKLKCRFRAPMPHTNEIWMPGYKFMSPTQKSSQQQLVLLSQISTEANPASESQREILRSEAAVELTRRDERVQHLQTELHLHAYMQKFNPQNISKPLHVCGNIFKSSESRVRALPRMLRKKFRVCSRPLHRIIHGSYDVKMSYILRYKR